MFLKITSIFAVLILEVENKPELTCDSLKHKPLHEGNLGQSGVLPWLGVIRAHVRYGSKINIAVTGAILVKPKHAIANADDMSKIRKKGNSKAMFISSDRGTWTCQLSEVAVHPEYEFATYNTIALVELDTETLTGAAPMLPVCMPSYMYNTSNQLYAFGFTDENKVLEKVAYKVQYVERALCDEFYERAGHGKGMYTPERYQCAFAENNKGDCAWENGMALVSNASGYWVLVGFGVQGPGCSAPARFIDVYPYIRWINSSSNIDDFDADYPFKVKVRRADSLEFTEQLTENLNRTDFFKRDHTKFNITFHEFLKQYKFTNKTMLVNTEKTDSNVKLNKIPNQNATENVTEKHKYNIKSDEIAEKNKTLNSTILSNNASIPNHISRSIISTSVLKNGRL